MEPINKEQEMRVLREAFPRLSEEVLTQVFNASFIQGRGGYGESPTHLNDRIEANALASAVEAAYANTWWDFTDSPSSRAQAAAQSALNQAGVRHTTTDITNIREEALTIVTNVLPRDAIRR